ncbi:DinB family protein [Bacillus thermotolerans]|uniref:DinB-like domain-containing protein n=1 Tax=Bacillus thermotolerans TaxID=1221996 RepID=A0A0F5I0G2_BACTR|nr:DinB family protein [Bacillus thermotolerans]KKB34674.1 hypothetical protein QY97_02224 [Bacillus thermotolerans]KKB38552.1 hypothetical protein QY95_02550 [Bacillus thermotolerans]
MAIWERLEFARSATVGTLEAIEEEKWNTQPEGFGNTIKWNAGHIYISLESLLQVAAPGYEAVKAEEYASLFSTGTRPSEWTDNGPSKQEMIELLSGQTERVKQYFEERLSDQPAQELAIGPLALKTIDDLINFSLFHEGMHIGIIQSQLKVLNK